MKKRLLLYIILCSFFTVKTQAQNNKENSSNLIVSLGASATYYYGQADRNFGKFEDDRVNWQINSMLGFSLSAGNTDKKTMIAAFGNYGLNNSKTISHIFDDQGYTTTAITQAGSNNYFQLEGGLLIAEMIRISTGVGQQNFESQSLSSTSGIITGAKKLKYSSSTVGFHFNLGKVGWLIDCNFAYGKDFNHTVITPSTGLMFKF